MHSAAYLPLQGAGQRGTRARGNTDASEAELGNTMRLSKVW